MSTEPLHIGDCLDVLDDVKEESVDLVYLDPPFFTQRVHHLTTRDGGKNFSFADIWDSDTEYADFIFQRLIKIREKLKPTGSVFFHCDKSGSHIIRLLLDSVFGAENFQSEIIWCFKRWSNSKRGLLNNHQTIYFYSKTSAYKFNPIYMNYSASTNVDQIMQRRSRDDRNKSIYARDERGKVISNGVKKGVPLSDVWDIPFLNPKAKERVGYPTQKPITLLEKIIQISTDEADVVLDPFCGSGSSLVAAKILKRNFIGIDVSDEAIALAKNRLENPVVSSSSLLAKGRHSYATHSLEAAQHLAGINYTPVQRNKGIDGLLKQEFMGLPAFIRVQREHETQDEAAMALIKAAQGKGKCNLLIVVTQAKLMPSSHIPEVTFIKSAMLQIEEFAQVTAPPARNKAKIMSSG